MIDDIAAKASDIRCLVVSSSIPKIFTAGIDCTFLIFRLRSNPYILSLFLNEVKSLGEIANFGSEQARTAYHTRNFILFFQNSIRAPERCPFPVIAAVHGPVMGLGMDIISACDVRYASSDATFSIKVRRT